MVNQVSEINLDENSLNLVKVKQNNKSVANRFFDFEILWEYFKRAIYKLGKIFLSFKPLKEGREKIRQDKVKKYRYSLTALQLQDQKVLDDLRNIGTYSIDIQDLGFESTPGLLDETSKLVDLLKQDSNHNGLFKDLESAKLADYPGIFLWGIEPRLLNLMEHHIGLPVYYQGYSIRRDIVSKDSNSKCIRAWHQDSEDRTVVKIIIYLNDVGIKDGHYQYIPQNLSKQVVKKLDYQLGYLDDQTVEAIVPQQNWMGCMGKLGTVIISDTSSVFHRAKPPEKKDRFSISFCYTTNKPKFYWDSDKIFPKNLVEISSELTEQQKRVLINKNKFFGVKFWLLGR